MGDTIKIAMRCADLAASRAFYEQVLELPVVDQWSEAHGDGCVYAHGTGLIELNEARKPESMDPQDSGSRPVRRFDIELEVSDLDPWIARVDGRWEHESPKTQPWGERTLRLRDPDGVMVTIYQKMP